MSQPRRRRRRRRSGGGGGQAGGNASPQAEQGGQRGQQPSGDGPKRSRSRRRGRGRGTGTRSSPKSSEDLVRALPQPRPENLTAPPDGQDLDELIGELQSTWGVPQYPQEYRITIKVAEERTNQDRGQNGGERRRERPAPPPADGAPRREKAPAPPRLARERAPGEGSPQAEGGPRKKRRSRRRRRGGGGGGNAGGGSAPNQGPPPPPSNA